MFSKEIEYYSGCLSPRVTNTVYPDVLPRTFQQLVYMLFYSRGESTPSTRDIMTRCEVLPGESRNGYTCRTVET